MKRGDLVVAMVLVMIFTPFILIDSAYRFYSEFYAEFPFISSFIKFAVLATIGELIGLRIRIGSYRKKGFGLVPRAIVWGFLGITIQAAFIIFASGSPRLLEFAGWDGASALMSGGFTAGKLAVAFSISFFLNIFYAPVLMTAHRITDTHIEMKGGTVKGLFSRMDIVSILGKIDWDTHYGFVIRKTIFLFWIPAQTINFMLPEQFRVLVAAIYGIILGIILAFAARAKTDIKQV